MYTASQKKKDNIAEYLLYMWQIEDLIRANGLDMERIKANILDKYTNLNEAQLKELAGWYESLIDMMRREEVQEKGHLQINRNVIIDLDDLSRRLLANPKYSDYSRAYYDVAAPSAREGNFARNRRCSRPCGQISCHSRILL